MVFRKKIQDLLDAHKSLSKSKNRNTKKDEENRERFKKDAIEVLWIAKKNIFQILDNIKDRDKEKVKLDKLFLKDQKSGKRSMRLDTRDRTFDERVKKTNERRQIIKDRLERGKANEGTELNISFSSSISVENSETEMELISVASFVSSIS